MSEGCPDDVQFESATALLDEKSMRISKEDIQRASRRRPEGVQRISQGNARGHPEGSKGSPEDGLGMYR